MKVNRIVMVIFCCVVLLAYHTTAAADNPRETPVVKVVRENAEAVVNISTERIILLRDNPFWGRYGSEFDLLFEEFFGLQQPKRALKLQSVGSGVILDKDGIIVSNAHVVNMASNVFVVFSDGSQVEGKVVYENPQDDIAIIKIAPPKELKAAALGTTADIMIGESVVAIGNPLGLENSVSVGVVSGKERNFYSNSGTVVADHLLQIDAPINPGNSGGALLNLEGKLVGINVAVVQLSQSIGFAIPVEKVKAALDDYERNKNFVIKRKMNPLPSGSQLSPTKPLAPSIIDEGEEPLDDWAAGERDPWAEMEQMRDRMNRIFEDSFRGMRAPQGKGMFNTDFFYDTNFQLEDKGRSYQIKLDIGKLDQNQIDIEIHDNSIAVSGKYSEQVDESGPQRSFSSKSYGSFLKTIPLPPDANPEKLTTEKAGDALIITIPKK